MRDVDRLLAVMSLAWAVGAFGQSAQQSRAALALDRALFAATLEALRREPGGPLRVDVRPLVPNPELVTMRDFDIIPERVDPTAATNMFAPADSATLAARRAVMRASGLDATDAIKDAKCPGILVPDSRVKRAKCPASDKPYQSVLVALPREGGPYWPNNFDDRPDFAGRKVYSIRILHLSINNEGSVELSRDLVFELNADGTWRYVRSRSLLIIE